ncbi:MAG: hypothetical protein ACP5NC_06910, partial [Nitrososphaeria archaeon]
CMRGFNSFIASLILSASACSFVLQSLFFFGLLSRYSFLMCSSIYLRTVLMFSSSINELSALINIQL